MYVMLHIYNTIILCFTNIIYQYIDIISLLNKRIKRVIAFVFNNMLVVLFKSNNTMLIVMALDKHNCVFCWWGGVLFVHVFLHFCFSLLFCDKNRATRVGSKRHRPPVLSQNEKTSSGICKICLLKLSSFHIQTTEKCESIQQNMF